MKYLILGDVHGQYDRLMEILEKYFESATKVIFLWDYIDKNKKSIETLWHILDLKKQFSEKVELIWWNHDIFLMNSLLYKDKRLFNTWFYLNRAYRTTLFDYVPWNDRVLFTDGYEEFVDEYFDLICSKEDLVEQAKLLLELWNLYYKDDSIFAIHWGIPINIIRRNEYKNITIYKWEWMEWMRLLEDDYKNYTQERLSKKSKQIAWIFWTAS